MSHPHTDSSSCTALQIHVVGLSFSRSDFGRCSQSGGVSRRRPFWGVHVQRVGVLLDVCVCQAKLQPAGPLRPQDEVPESRCRDEVPESRRHRDRSCSPSPHDRSCSPSPVADITLPDGVWQCPGCNSLNNASGPRSMWCCGCSERRPLVQVWKPGDWFCKYCGNHNFRGRRSCNNTWCPSMTTKPGDWVCPNCGNHNYSSRLVCNSNSCRFRKPQA